MKRGVTALKVAGVYIGTVVGAGFATGQEILQFFTRFGLMGLFGLVLSAGLFSYFGCVIMEVGRDLGARSHVEIIRYAGGEIIGTLVDWIITAFLFGSLTAMVAGTGALFTQLFGLPALLGNILMCLFTALTVLRGLSGVIDSISFVVPFLLVAVVGVSVYSIVGAPPDLTAAYPAAQGGALNSNWLLSAILYVSYNTIISVAVLGPLGVGAKDKRSIRSGAVLGGIGLFVGSLMIHLAIAGNLPGVAALEVPMIFISGGISPAVQTLYAVVLIAEIYTTAVGSLYGFVSRLTKANENPARLKTLVVGVMIAALLLSQLGFSNLVKYLYPLVGYGGIALLLSLAYIHYKRRGPV